MTHSFIDAARCTGCGTCARVCPNHLFQMDRGGTISFLTERKSLCIHCGQCMMVCPTKAPQIEGLDYERDFHPMGDDLINSSNLLDFLRTRRSVRCFAPRKVPQEVLSQLVEIIETAPMGFPPHKIRITIVTDPVTLQEAGVGFKEFYAKMSRGMDNPIGRFFMRITLPGSVFMTLKNHVQPTVKASLMNGSWQEHDPVLRHAPVLILFGAHRLAENHEEDGMIALSYGLLAAHSLKLGATAIGLIPPAINRSRPLQHIFQLQNNERIVGAMICGYPAVRYRRTVTRHLNGVEWI